jgi:nickel transport protein
MKNTSIWILTLFFMLVSTTGVLQAHKLEVSLTQKPPVVVIEAGYSGHHHGLSGGDVFIYAPGEAEKAFQTGKTDVEGKFAFIPTKAGEWRVVVDDGTGHRSEEVLSLGEDFLAPEKAVIESERGAQGKEVIQEPETAPSQAQVPLLWKVLVGVSLLFGIAGILYGMKARQKSG